MGFISKRNLQGGVEWQRLQTSTLRCPEKVVLDVLSPCSFHEDICFISENYDYWYYRNAISDRHLWDIKSSSVFGRQSAASGFTWFRPMNTLETKLGSILLNSNYFKTVMDFIGKQQMFMWVFELALFRKSVWSFTAPSLLKQKQLGPVDRTRPNNKPAQDHHPNTDGFMFMELHTYTVGSET